MRFTPRANDAHIRAQMHLTEVSAKKHNRNAKHPAGPTTPMTLSGIAYCDASPAQVQSSRSLLLASDKCLVQESEYSSSIV
jgi:hypothetical protein